MAASPDSVAEAHRAHHAVMLDPDQRDRREGDDVRGVARPRLQESVNEASRSWGLGRSRTSSVTAIEDAVDQRMQTTRTHGGAVHLPALLLDHGVAEDSANACGADAVAQSQHEVWSR